MGGESVMRWPEDPNAPKIASYDLALIRLKNALLQGKHLRRDGVLAIEEKAIKEKNLKDVIVVENPNTAKFRRHGRKPLAEIVEPYQVLDVDKQSKHRNGKWMDVDKKKKRRSMAKQSRKQNRR